MHGSGHMRCPNWILKQWYKMAKEFLRGRGASHMPPPFQPSCWLLNLQNPEVGLAVYPAQADVEERLTKGWWQWATSWMRSPKDFVLATVPLDHAVTVKTIVADVKLGQEYEQLLRDGTSHSSSPVTSQTRKCMNHLMRGNPLGCF